MISDSEIVPLMSSVPGSPSRFTTTRDIETGLHQYLPVSQAVVTLENRKIQKIEITGCAIFGLSCCLLVTLVCSFVALLELLSEFCEPEGSDYAPWYCYFPSVAFAGNFMALCFGGPFLCLGMPAGMFQFCYERFQLNKNRLIQKKIDAISYAVSSDEPLKAKDFVRLYRNGYMKTDEIQKLSFQQLREIKALEERVFTNLTRNLSRKQKGPWNKLDLIRAATLGDLKKTFSEEYVRSQIERTPGFLEELINVLPRDLSRDHAASEVFIDNVRHYLSQRFDYEFPDEVIMENLQDVYEGALLEDCFYLSRHDDQMIELSCGERRLSVSANLLKEFSDYFKALFDFSKGLSVIPLENLTEDQFDVFIEYLKGKRVPIDLANVEEYLEIASYFQIRPLAEACENPLIIKMKKRSLTSKIDMLERYPILTGPFKSLVDQEFAKSLKLKKIRKDPDSMLQITEKAQSLGLEHTLKVLRQSFITEVKKWKREGALVQDCYEFVKSANLYHLLLPDSDDVDQILKEMIYMRLDRHDTEINRVYEETIKRPTLLFVEALYTYMVDVKNRDYIEGKFVAVGDYLKKLKELEKQLESDKRLLSQIQEWKSLDLMLGTFEDFESELLDYYSEILTTTYHELIEKELMNCLHSRLSWGGSVVRKCFCDRVQEDESPHPFLVKALETLS